MTIIHVPRRFTPQAWGGTEQVLSNTLPQLAHLGHASRIVTTTALDNRQHSVDAGIRVERHGYSYGEWPLSAKRKQRFDYKGGNCLSFGLSQAIRHSNDVHLVHCHTGNRLGASALAAARQRHIPCVLTLHGGHFAIPDEEIADLAASEYAKAWSIPWGKAYSWWWDSRHLLENVDALICVGIDEYEAARKALPKQRVYFVPGGVEPRAWQHGDPRRGYAHMGVSGKRPIIVCVGRLDRQKDQKTLVSAWAKMHMASDLVLIGPETSPGYADELRRIGGSNSLSNSLRRNKGQLVLCGGLDAAKIPDCLAAATLATLPSRHEPFGLAALEAMAAGTCLVASKVGGPAWLLQDGAGVLVEAGDVQAWSHSLDTLLRHTERRCRIAALGQAKIGDEFTWAKRAERLHAIYAACGGCAHKETRHVA